MYSEAEIEELSALLPFYVKGTLDDVLCTQIDAALSQSAELRDELVHERALAHTVSEGANAMIEGADNTEARLDAVLGRLGDKVPEVAPLAAPAKPAALGSLLAFLNPKKWRPAVSLTLALGMLLQGAWIGGQQQHIKGLEYQLASGPDGAQLGSLLLQLRPEARWADVEALLGNEGLTIVGGPSDGALMVASSAKGAELDALIARLRASALIAAVDKVA